MAYPIKPCIRCGGPRTGMPRKHCTACAAHAVDDHRAKVRWQLRAIAAVARAIKRGLLPSLSSGTHACVDCGGAANIYDHRDYAKPLDVVPVCRSCNGRRGVAVWPGAKAYQTTKRAIA